MQTIIFIKCSLSFFLLSIFINNQNQNKLHKHLKARYSKYLNSLNQCTWWNYKIKNFKPLSKRLCYTSKFLQRGLCSSESISSLAHSSSKFALNIDKCHLKKNREKKLSLEKLFLENKIDLRLNHVESMYLCANQ